MNRVRKPRPRTIPRVRAARVCGSIDIGRADRSEPCPAQTRPQGGGGAEDHDARGMQARSRPRSRATQARLCVQRSGAAAALEARPQAGSASRPVTERLARARLGAQARSGISLQTFAGHCRAPVPR